jgi:enamine deaminase RidA (YjgF/YER057c/UK114 family)
VAKAGRDERNARHQAFLDAWQAQVFAHFNFLMTEYGLRKGRIVRSDGWVTTVRYMSRLLAVEVINSVEDDCIKVV